MSEVPLYSYVQDKIARSTLKMERNVLESGVMVRGLRSGCPLGFGVHGSQSPHPAPNHKPRPQTRVEGFDPT